MPIFRDAEQTIMTTQHMIEVWRTKWQYIGQFLHVKNTQNIRESTLHRCTQKRQPTRSRTTVIGMVGEVGERSWRDKSLMMWWHISTYIFKYTYLYLFLCQLEWWFAIMDHDLWLAELPNDLGYTWSMWSCWRRCVMQNGFVECAFIGSRTNYTCYVYVSGR